jgi:fumarylpyruvate hydrolase
MTEAFVIAAPSVSSVPVQGGGAFPVRRIFCVGRNYAAHVREMGGDPRAEPPIFFTKPADAIVTARAATPYPPATENLHHEMELVLAIGTGGANIPAAQALDHIWGYAAGLDMTRRDMQATAVKGGKPWDMSKGFDYSAPIGDIAPASRIGHPARGRIALTVNGVVRQNADLGDMIWDIPAIVAALSALVTLAPGDLIFTGTPEGVGAVVRGDLLQGEIEGVGHVATRIA